MQLEPIGWFESPFGEKFGTPRQSGVVPEVPGVVHFYPQFARPEALRGLEGFDWIWILWEFSLNKEDGVGHSTVRAPRLGGNERMGVFATRSPYRPNPIGLSSVRLTGVDTVDCTLNVVGGDLVDGTPILDIKPYIAYTDAHPDALGGFTDSRQWHKLSIGNPSDAARLVPRELVPSLLCALENDPRPQYHKDNTRVYGLKFAGCDIHFTIADDIITILTNE